MDFPENASSADFAPSEVEDFNPNDTFSQQDDLNPPFEPDSGPFAQTNTETLIAELTAEPAAEMEEELAPEKTQLLDELSSEFFGRWNRLVSRTNWEKGEVILRWRNRLIEAGLPNTVYSDEAWAKRVGNVSSQHVGRLRRVYERFGEGYEQYPSLFWSHFQAALDWEDAEMWLEGANLNQWSVATMRIQRWETLGAPEDMKPREQDIILAELDEDVNPYNDSRSALEGAAGRIDPTDKSSRSAEDDEFSESGKKKKKNDKDHFSDSEDCPTTGEALAKLASIADLPEDVSEPLMQLKIAILNHKLAGWKDLRPQEVLGILSALRTVVLAKDDE